MTPDIGLRLTSIIKSLEQVIAPAIDHDNPLALEQAALAVAHLKVIQAQWQFVADYLVVCLSEMIEVGEALIGIAEGGPETLAARADLERQLVGMNSGPPLHTLAKRRNILATAIDALIRAAEQDCSVGCKRTLQRIVLRHGARQTHRDRTWFAATGLDPDRADLVAIPEMLISAPRPEN